MQLMQTGNPFLNFANRIMGKYQGATPSFAQAPMTFMDPMREDRQEESAPLPSTTNYFYHVQNIRQENYLYQENLTFLTNVLEKQFYQKFYPTAEKQIERVIRETVTQVSEKQVHELTQRVIEQMPRETTTVETILKEIEHTPEVTRELVERLQSIYQKNTISVSPEKTIIVPEKTVMTSVKGEDGKTVYRTIRVPDEKTSSQPASQNGIQKISKESVAKQAPMQVNVPISLGNLGVVLPAQNLRVQSGVLDQNAPHQNAPQSQKSVLTQNSHSVVPYRDLAPMVFLEEREETKEQPQEESSSTSLEEERVARSIVENDAKNTAETVAKKVAESIVESTKKEATEKKAPEKSSTTHASQGESFAQKRDQRILTRLVRESSQNIIRENLSDVISIATPSQKNQIAQVISQQIVQKYQQGDLVLPDLPALPELVLQITDDAVSQQIKQAKARIQVATQKRADATKAANEVHSTSASNEATVATANTTSANKASSSAASVDAASSNVASSNVASPSEVNDPQMTTAVLEQLLDDSSLSSSDNSSDNSSAKQGTVFSVDTMQQMERELENRLAYAKENGVFLSAIPFAQQIQNSHQGSTLSAFSFQGDAPMEYLVEQAMEAITDGANPQGSTLQSTNQQSTTQQGTTQQSASVQSSNSQSSNLQSHTETSATQQGMIQQSATNPVDIARDNSQSVQANLPEQSFDDQITILPHAEHISSTEFAEQISRNHISENGNYHISAPMEHLEMDNPSEDASLVEQGMQPQSMRVQSSQPQSSQPQSSQPQNVQAPGVQPQSNQAQSNQGLSMNTVTPQRQSVQASNAQSHISSIDQAGNTSDSASYTNEMPANGPAVFTAEQLQLLQQEKLQQEAYRSAEQLHGQSSSRAGMPAGYHSITDQLVYEASDTLEGLEAGSDMQSQTTALQVQQIAQQAQAVAQQAQTQAKQVQAQQVQLQQAQTQAKQVQAQQVQMQQAQQIQLTPQQIQDLHLTNRQVEQLQKLNLIQKDTKQSSVPLTQASASSPIIQSETAAEVANQIVSRMETITVDTLRKQKNIDTTPDLLLKNSARVVAAQSVARQQIAGAVMEYYSGDMDAEQLEDNISQVLTKYRVAMQEEAPQEELRTILRTANSGKRVRIRTNFRPGSSDTFAKALSLSHATQVRPGGPTENRLRPPVSIDLTYSEDMTGPDSTIARQTRELAGQVQEVVKNLQNVEQRTIVHEENITQTTEVVRQVVEKQTKEKTAEVQKTIRAQVIKTVQDEMDDSVEKITNRVYRRLEDRLRMERGRRGL